MAEIATGLMLTAVALFSGAESDVGHVAFLEPQPGEPAGPQKLGMMQDIAEAFLVFEDGIEGTPAHQREAMQLAMHEMAQKYEAETQGGGGQWR